MDQTDFVLFILTVLIVIVIIAASTVLFVFGQWGYALAGVVVAAAAVCTLWELWRQDVRRMLGMGRF